MTPADIATVVDRTHKHSVQFYTSDEFLVNDLERLVGSALLKGCSALIISTQAHQDMLAEKLECSGLDLPSIRGEGRYQSYDASEVLSHFMIGGTVNQFCFFEVLSAVIAKASSASRAEGRQVVAFGEMVALLWAEGKAEAAIQLEKLWNALARSHSLSLHCAYPLQGFRMEKDADALLRICEEHSLVLPEGESAEAVAQGALQPHAAGWEDKEHRFRQFVEAVQDYAILMLDPEGYIRSWNTGAERIKGYSRSEILGSHFSRFYPAEDVRSGKPQKLLALAEKMGRVEDQGWRVRKDGTRFWAQVTITAIRNKTGELIGFGKVTRDLTDQKHAESVLHRQEERFQLFVHAVQDYAMFMLDPDGYVTSWNIGAERIKGYTASEIIGRHFSCFYPPEVRNEKPGRALEMAARYGRFEDEGWRLRKDGSRFWADVVITTITDEQGEIIGFGKVTRDLTERMLTQQALEESQQRLRDSEKVLRELSLHLLRTQDEERRRIGREMHESLGQYLSAAKIKLDSMSLASDLESEAAECANLLEACLKEVRTVSYLLYPPLLEEMGLGSAIPWYLGGFSKRSGIQTSFGISDDFGRIARDAELVLFRVLQESLTNVQRHSGSSTADVRASRSSDSVILEIQDYGKGLPEALFDLGSQDWLGSAGVGLRGMSERLRQLGGSLNVVSDSGGTFVRATVPLYKT